jgi:hypothetical protein
MGGDTEGWGTKSKQLIVGAGQISPSVEKVFAPPGTSLFFTDNSILDEHGRIIAAVRFPRGIIKNLKVTVLLNRAPCEGFITIAVHAKRDGLGSSATGIHVRLLDSGDADTGDREYQLEDDDRVYIKVDTNFVGPDIIGFNYSFEFDQN